jgi:hypothetical protein
MEDVHPFHVDLEALGFRMIQQDRKGVVQYSLRATRYLTYWIHWDPDEGTVLFTWELAIGDYMHNLGLQIGANESLNTFLYPQYDAKGPDEVAFIAGELDRTEAVLRAMDLTADA